MCQMSWRLQNRNHQQFRKKKLTQLRVQQLLLHLKLMLKQKSLRVRMTRLLKMEQHMIKMKRSQQKVLRAVHLPAVLLEAHLENFQILTMEGQQAQRPHPVIRNLKVMIIGVLGLCFLATRVSMNQHGGHLTLMMMLTQCGVSMQLVPPRIWIRRVIRITTFLALGSSASTLSGLGHHKEVVFPRRAALLLSMILFPAHQCLPSIQDIHHQSTRIVQNLHSTPSPGLIRLEAPKILDTSLNQKHLEDLILCAAVEILIRVMDFQHLMTSQTLLALQRHLGLILDGQTPRRDSDPFGSSGSFRMSLDSQTPRRESDFFGSSVAPFRTSFDSQTPRGDSDAFGSSPFRTSFDSQTPRQDSDPFGFSGPFRTSMENPRKDSDHWSAF